MSRPEHLAPPEEFYNADEAKKYAVNSRMREIQTSLTERALELLALPGEDMLLLDVGCGSGLSEPSKASSLGEASAAGCSTRYSSSQPSTSTRAARRRIFATL